MKTFLRNAAIFLVVVAALQFVVGHLIAPPRSSRIERARRFVREQPQVIVFGDSVNGYAAPQDHWKESISQLLRDRLGGMTLGSLDRPAYQMAVYRAYMEFMRRHDYDPPCVVLPINVQTFGPRWCRRPGFQFARDRLMLAHEGPLFNATFKPLHIFGWYNLTPITHRAFLETPVYDGDEQIGAVADFEKLGDEPPNRARTAEMLRYLYMGRLEADHPYLQDLRAMLERRAPSTRLVVYATPVDVEAGVDVLGPRFRQRLRDNLAVVRDLLAEYDVPLHDFSEELPHRAFHYPKYPNEHLAYDGRVFVAEHLARIILAPDPTKNPAP